MKAAPRAPGAPAKAALALAALALGAAALAPSSASADVPAREGRSGNIESPAAPAMIEGVVGTSQTPGLPEVVTPAPLELGQSTASLAWSYESEGLRVVGADGLPFEESPLTRSARKASSPRPKARGRKKAPPPHADADTLRVRVEGSAAPTLVAFAWQAPQSTYANALSLPCRPWLEGPVRWPLRWETLRGDASNAPLWQVNDGWYDERSCQISVERRTALRPAVLVRQGSRPAVLAAREGDSVTLLIAPTRSLLTHDLSGALRATLGPFARVSVPVGPGQAASIVASFHANALGGWWQRAGATPSPLVNLGPPETNLLEVRVDLSQAVAERELTLAVQRTTDDPNEPTSSGSDVEFQRQLGQFMKARHKR